MDHLQVSSTSDLSSSQSLHPLEPLTADEIARAITILRSAQNIHERMRFISVNLKEPEKQSVLNYQAGTPSERAAFIVLLDKASGTTYEATISVTQNQLTDWHSVPGVQPALIAEDVADCEEVVKANADFREALRRRGITDLSVVMVDSWTVGNYGKEEEQTRRLLRSLVYLRAHPEDNPYAKPVEGIIVYTDMNKLEVLRVEDYGILPVPPESGNFSTESVGQLRQDLKPLEITQPEGPSFSVNGHEVSWQKWHFRIGFNTREGLVLYNLGYEDQGQIRPILYRGSLAELAVPYGDPGYSHYRKTAFDVGEYGVGLLANSLELGCDCLGHIQYFDEVITDGFGQVKQMPNVICMHEEDYGILWKHHNWFANKTEVRRSRRLVISFIATIDNYDYGFFWYLYQDGTIEFEAKLTGILSTGAAPEGEVQKYGQLVAPQLTAPIHQHIFCFRLDMMVDGVNNSVYEVHTEAEAPGDKNPHGNAFFSKSTLLATESEGQQLVDTNSARYWKIANPNKKNRLGESVAYKLMPGENTIPFLQPGSSVMKRAGFITKHLWVTPYQLDEKYPAGDYPNQSAGGAGLPSWTSADRSIENTDVVLWYVMNAYHLPRPEDWPVMPVAYSGFKLKPNGFFERNPALDVPPPAHHDACEDHADHHDHQGH
jgi:primary-amine oxidase